MWAHIRKGCAVGRFVCPNDYPAGCTCRDPYCKSRRRKQGGAGRATRGIVSGAITLAGAYGDVTSMPQSGDAPLRDEAKVQVDGERTTRTRGLRRETTYKDRQNGGSSSTN